MAPRCWRLVLCLRAYCYDEWRMTRGAGQLQPESAKLPFAGTGFTRVPRRLQSAKFMPYTPRIGALIAHGNCHIYLICLSTPVGQHVFRLQNVQIRIRRGEIWLHNTHVCQLLETLWTTKSPVTKNRRVVRFFVHPKLLAHPVLSERTQFGVTVMQI